jgi:predicted metal-binding membrane protein
MKGRRSRTIREFAWRHPEWWAVAFSAGAWMWLAGGELNGAAMRGMPMHAAGSWRGEAIDQLVMIAAMMLPMAIGPIRATAARSLWQRRHRAMVLFLAGYASLWLGAGLTLIALHLHAGWTAWSGVMALAVAAVWQATPVKQRALCACRRTIPLSPTGWRADRDCLRYGCLSGSRCIVSCWALMLVPMVFFHSIVLMAVATVVGVAEREWPRAAMYLSFRSNRA